MTTDPTTTHKPTLWSPGDWNAFFGFGTNILVNMLTLTALLRYVLKLPDELVFGRILPATGLMLFLSTVYYAWLAWRLAKQSRRDDVCALPSGISVPHMFVVVFVVMMPILNATKDPMQAWGAGLKAAKASVLNQRMAVRWSDGSMGSATMFGRSPGPDGGMPSDVPAPVLACALVP